MIFGTDGVRGVVDKEINTKLAYDIGKGMALYIHNKNLNKKIVIGSDTRPSSDTLLAGLTTGLTDYGIDVEIVGIVSTPIISFLVSRLDFGGGIMVTASHNDYTYNGIKVFNQFGEKLNKNGEDEIERNITSECIYNNNKGKITYNEYLIELYLSYLRTKFENLDLKNKTIVLDCANGSNYKIAPYIFKKFGANVIPIFCNNDGQNINNNCGANHIEKIVETVKQFNADYGFAFDGDGDRLRIITSDAKVMAGDDILLVLAMYLKKINNLKNLTVAGTIMTNIGTEKTLNNFGIKMLRSDVGDKNVIQLMKDNCLSIGGESSGHICLFDYIPNCDALYNSLFYLNSIKDLGDFENTIIKSSIKYPCAIKNINVDLEFRKNFDNNESLNRKIIQMNNKNKNVKIVVRPSGTEPVIRLYVESESEILNERILNKLEDLIKNMQ